MLMLNHTADRVLTPRSLQRSAEHLLACRVACHRDLNAAFDTVLCELCECVCVYVFSRIRFLLLAMLFVEIGNPPFYQHSSRTSSPAQTRVFKMFLSHS